MFRLLKKLFGFLWKQKKLLIFVFIFTALFFSLRFPWNHLLEKTVKKAQTNLPPSFQTEFEKIRFRLFPPGIEFKNLSLNYRIKFIQLDSLKVSLVLSHWLAFKKAWSFKAVKENSSLFVIFWKKEKILKDEGLETPVVIYFVRGSSPFLKLEVLNGLFPNMKMSGTVQTHFDYEGNLERIQETKASFSLKGENIQFSKMELKTPMGPLSFPSAKWKEVEVVYQLKEEEIVFKTFRWGSPSDDLIIQMKGSGSVGFAFRRVRVNSYNIQLQIDVDKNYQIPILDVMFAEYKEDKGGFYRYRLRMTGQGNQVPNMEKLEEF